MNENRIVLANADEEEGKLVSSLTKDDFQFVQEKSEIHDQAFETKPISYLHDCWRRFAKNKSSIVGGIIILLIILYAIIVPFVEPKAHVSQKDFPNGYQDINFRYATPYLSIFNGTGFWDGSTVRTVSENDYLIYQYDDGNHPRAELISKNETKQTIGSTTLTTVTYTIREDTYAIGCKNITISQSEYQKLTEYEQEQGIYHTENSISKPFVDASTYLKEYQAQLEKEMEEGANLTQPLITGIIDYMSNYYNQNPNVYFALTAKNPTTGQYSQNRYFPVLDANGEPVSIYATDENGDEVYYRPTTDEVTIRVDYFDWFVYRYGFLPYSLFGTNAQGQDIFLRLAEGARFSLILGVCISLVNFVIGLVWGAVSGYYGGKVDLFMERCTDIIANIPSIIILTICQIQFLNNNELIAAVGSGGMVILAILVAFVYNGWTGVASTTRMQFYRFKSQEYVLASRTLGARDRRLIFRHILPNAVGTLVTSSVLMVPSVIFSESSLSYLGIIDFASSGLSSIGTLLNEGQQAGLANYPHMLLFPCIVISLLMICFNLFGNGLRDAFNTSLKGSED